MRPPLAWVALAAFGWTALALSVSVALAKAPIAGERRVARVVQDTPGAATAFDAVNGVGDWQWAILLALVSLLFVRRRWRGGASREAIAAFIIAAPLLRLDAGLKETIRSPRPMASDGLRVDMARESYGFPSGHVYGDVLLAGLVFLYCPCWVPRPLVRPVRGLLVGFVAAAGPARIYVGAHWPSDTVGGYLWGGFALALCVVAARAWTRSYARKR